MPSSKTANARILRLAAAAGVTTEVHTDGPGRYIVTSETGNGTCLVEKQGSAWRVYSPIHMGYAPATLGTAFKVCAQLIEQEAEMTARAAALTDEEIANTLANREGVEYHYLQRVIAQRCHREYVAAKAAV